MSLMETIIEWKSDATNAPTTNGPYFIYNARNDITLNESTGKVEGGTTEDLFNIQQIKKSLDLLNDEYNFEKLLKSMNKANQYFNNYQLDLNNAHNKLAHFVLGMLNDFLWINKDSKGSAHKNIAISGKSVPDGIELLYPVMKTIWNAYVEIIDMKYSTNIVKHTIQQNLDVQKLEFKHDLETVGKLKKSKKEKQNGKTLD